MQAALGVPLVLAAREIDPHVSQAGRESRLKIDLFVGDAQVVDAAADHLAAAHERRKIPGVAGERAIRRVEVEVRPRALVRHRLGVDLEDLRAHPPRREPHPLADDAAHAVRADDHLRFDVARGRLDDDRAVARVAHRLDARPVAHVHAARRGDLRERVVELDAADHAADCADGRSGLAVDGKKRNPVDGH